MKCNFEKMSSKGDVCVGRKAYLSFSLYRFLRILWLLKQAGTTLIRLYKCAIESLSNGAVEKKD